MKAVKKILSALFCTLFIFISIGVNAEPLYNAEISLSFPGKKSDVIYLSYNENFDVSLNVKSGANYFAGPLSVQVFYTDSIFDNSSGSFNEKSKLYNCSKSYCTITDLSAMTELSKNKFYPSSWKSDDKKKYGLCNVMAVPNAVDCKVSVSSLDENIAALNFTANGNAGDKGTVFISNDSIRTLSNPYGETYFSCLTNSGNVLSSRYDYGNDTLIDISKACLNFEITDIGDADHNKKINSTDALMILQYVTDFIPMPDSDSKICDTNCDEKFSSADALCVLQMATGIVRINDLIKK